MPQGLVFHAALKGNVKGLAKAVARRRLEPGISVSGGRRLIHSASGPLDSRAKTQRVGGDTQRKGKTGWRGESCAQACGRAWAPDLIATQRCLVLLALFSPSASPQIATRQITPATAGATLQTIGLIEEHAALNRHSLAAQEKTPSRQCLEIASKARRCKQLVERPRDLHASPPMLQKSDRNFTTGQPPTQTSC